MIRLWLDLENCKQPKSNQTLNLDGGEGASKGGGPSFDFAGTFNDMSTVDWAELKEKLLTAGESLSDDDLKVCLRALTGSDELPDGPLTAETFIDQVLGFEDYEADE